MKFCIINNLFQPFERGGAETVVGNIARGLEKSGHEAVIVSTRPFFSKTKPESGGFRTFYLSGFYYNLDKMPKFLRLFWHIMDMFDLGSFRRVKNILKKENPDVVITNNLKGIGYLIPWAVKKSGAKHIHILHDIQLLHPSGLLFKGKEKIIDSRLAKIYQRVNRKLFSAADTVISPSNWLLQTHIERGFFKDSKKAVLPNPAAGVEQEGGGKKRDGGIFKFLYVGQVGEYKGVFKLIDAFSSLPLSGNLELTIIGGGGENLARERAGGNKNIKLLGRKSRAEVDKYMRASDCLVMPSLCYENSPMVIYEAFAAGLPVIASRIGGIPELLLGNGILFEAGSTEDLARRLLWAIGNRDELKKIGETGRERIKENSVDGYIKKLLNLL